LSGFYQDDFFGRGLPPGPGWQLPLLSDAIAPDANGATLDSQGLLTGPIVEVSPGRFQFPVSGGAAAILPSAGAAIILPFRLPDNSIATTSPRCLVVEIQVHTGGASASGLVLAAGISDDTAGTTVIYGGIDYDGADLRARAGVLAGVFAATAERTGCTKVSTSMLCRAAVSGQDTEVYSVFATLSTDATGNRNTSALKVVGGFYPTGQQYLAISVFGSGVLAAVTPEFSVRYNYGALPFGERF